MLFTVYLKILSTVQIIKLYNRTAAIDDPVRENFGAYLPNCTALHPRRQYLNYLHSN
jgi:hypothetical protein